MTELIAIVAVGVAVLGHAAWLDGSSVFRKVRRIFESAGLPWKPVLPTA